MKILFLGDVVGRTGRRVVARFLEAEKKNYDLIIANADNVASGRGPTEKTYDEMLEAGVDVLTCGDHIWDQREVTRIFEKKNCRLVRPANYPEICPGKGWISFNILGQDVLIVSMLGRVFTAEGIDSPFQIIDEILKSNKEKIVIVDFHAEATSEKMAFGYDMAGKVSAVLGSHTHVQTSDERIIDGKTAYISDTGSCAAYESVIGVKHEQSIKRFRTGMPVTFEVAEGDAQINAVSIEIDEATGHAISIERINKIVE